MTISEDFVVKLKATSAVTAIVGSGSSARIHRNFPPTRAAMPYIVFGRVNRDSDMCLDGPGGIARTDLAIECRASTPASAETLSDAVIAALDGASGTWGSSTVRGSFIGDVDDEYLPFPPGSDGGEHTVAKVARIHHVV